MINVSAKPIPSLRLFMIPGRLAGSATVQNRSRRLAPKLRATSKWRGSICSTLAATFRTTRKNTLIAIVATLLTSPIPSSTITSGSSAIFGIG